MHSAGEHTARPQTWEARRSAWSGQASWGLRERSHRAPTSGTCSRLAHVANWLSYSAGLRDKSGQAAGMLLRNEITDSPSNKFKRRHLGPFSTGTNSPEGLRGVTAASSGGRPHAERVLVQPHLDDSGQPSSPR